MKSGYKICIFILLFVSAFPVINASAHPHVFIDPGAVLVFENQELKRVRVSWTFDDMTSLSIIELYDTNKNGKFEPAEVKELMETTFNNFGQFHFYTYLETDGKNAAYASPVDFKAIIGNNNSLTYEFTIHINKKISNQIKIWFFDETNFVAFEMNKNNVRCKLVNTGKPSITVKEENYIDKAAIKF